MITDVARLQIRVDSLEVQLADRRLRDLQRSGKATEGGMGALYASTKRLAGVLGGAYLGHKLLMSAFENIRSAEKLNAMLITATGSAEGAKIAMSDLSKIAIETPFSLEGLTEAFIKLKNLGLDPSEEALRSYGETASSMGKDIEDIIRAIAGASVGEFEALKGFGIKAKIEGDKISLIFGGVKTTIENNAEAIQRYMIDLGNTNFAGSMARQMDTINGKLANLGDAFFQFSAAVGDSGVGAAVAKALDISTALIDVATIRIKEISLDINKATVADIALLEKLIQLNAQTAQPRSRNVAGGSLTSLYAGPTVPSETREEAIARLNAPIQAKIEELSVIKEQQKVDEELVALAERKNRANELSIEYAEKRWRAVRLELGDQELLNELIAERADLQAKALAGEAGNPDAAQDRIAKLDEQISKLAETIAKLDEEQAQRLGRVTESLMSETEALRASYEERRQIILEATLKTEEERLALLAKLEDQYKGDVRDAEIERWRTALSAFDDFQDNMLVLAKTGNKDLANVFKAAAIANTVIKTYESATSAYAALASIPYVGPALGAAAAAAAIAAGLANVSAIKQQGAGNYAGGGIVPGNSYSGDNMTANVNSGEAILNMRQQRELWDMANGRSKGGNGPAIIKIENHNVQTEVTQTQDDQGRQMLVLRNSIKREVKAEVARELNEGVGQVASGFNVAYTRSRKGGS